MPGSVVLGLNDALVELTGALAGFTFAFKDSQLIALAGLITGVSASFSMAASEYLSTKAEEGEQDPLRSAIYTGIAYLVTVFLLVIPFLILDNYLFSLIWTILNAIVVIAVFNYYISVAKGYNFRRRFLEMASISLGVALFSFILGNFISNWLGVEIKESAFLSKNQSHRETDFFFFSLCASIYMIHFSLKVSLYTISMY